MSRVKLGDVAQEYKATVKDCSNLPIVGLEHLTPGEITLERWDEGTENTFTKGFKKGQMLFGRRRAYLKKAAVAPFDGVCSGDITVIEAIPGKILPELLPFIIQNDLLFDYAVGKSAGSLSPRVKWVDLKDYEFELPEIEKQASLVDLLKAAHATRKAYQEQIKATDDLVKSQFIEMFGNEKEVVRLDQLCAHFGDGDWIESKDQSEEGIRLIQTGNVVNGEYKDKGDTGLLVITDTMLNRVTLNWKKGKRTHVFIDEFHVVFENEFSAQFFNSAWRQFRKRNAYPTAITQNVEYLLDSVQASTMLSNSEFVIMLNQAASDREKLAQLLNISNEQMSYITNADAGCGLIKYGSALVPFINQFPRDTKLYQLMTTRPGEGEFARGQD